MIKYLLLFSLLGLIQGRPQVDLYEPHDACQNHEHRLLPHEYDCTKFYYCEYGMKWITPRECSLGTEFSYRFQVCIHPRLANCNLPGSPTDATDISTESYTEPFTATEFFTVSPTQSSTTSESSVTTEPATATYTTPEDLDPEYPTTENPAPEGLDPDYPATEDPAVEEDISSIDFLPNGCPSDIHVHYLLPHETDCDKFYYCVRGETVERECAPGTYFNPKIQVCDWPENVDCANNGTEEDDDEDNEDVDGGNPDDNEDVDGGNPDDNEDVDGGNPDDNEDVDDDNENGADPDEEGDTPGGILPNGCPADFDVHKLIPHETECDKFYYCVFGEKVERDCAPGTYFNYEIQVCDWPYNVNCTAYGNESDKPDGGDGDNGGEGDNGGNGDDDDNVDGAEWDTLPNGCPADFEVHQLLPHESNCSRFYYCVSGDKVERECAPGTHFNSALQVCDWPWSAGCELGSGDGNGESGGNDNDDGESDGGSGGNDNGDGDSDPGNGGNDNDNGDGDSDGGSGGNDNEDGESDGGNDGNDNGDGDTDGDNGGNGDNDDVNVDGAEWDTLPNGCPADFDIHQLLPHESNCSRFYYCVFGEKVERECAPGTHFNPAIQVCDWPWNAGCESGSGDGSNGDSGENGDSGDGGNGDNDGDGGNGDEDNNGDGVPVVTLPNGCPADFDVHQLLPHESNCSRFYYCVFGEKVERECAPGTHFNPAIQVCDWPWSAGCESGSGDGGNGDSDGNGDNDGDGGNGDNGGDGGNGDEDNNGDGVPVVTLPNGCPADFDVHQLLPHESNCSRFYYCVLGEKVERECPAGTHFNPAIQVCDWPWNAGCEAGDNGDNGGDGENGDGENGDGDSGDGDNGDGDNGDGDNGDGDNGDGDNGDGDNGDGDNGDGDNGDGDNGDGDNGDGDNGDGDNGDGDSDNGAVGGNNKCQGECNVLPWAHDTDCDKYYICNGDQPLLVVCSEGLHFNRKTHTCDFICNANCVREDVQTTADVDGVKVFLPWDKLDGNVLKLLGMKNRF